VLLLVGKTMSGFNNLILDRYRPREKNPPDNM
jgi:hypothetical protein